MPDTLHPISGILVPPAPFNRGDPPTRQAELTIYQLGPQEDEIIPALEILGQFNRRELRRFQGALPVTIPLPAIYYDRTNPFVALLRSSGTKFKIVSYPWLCPDEQEVTGGNPHTCNGTCSVMEMVETLTS